MLINWLLSRIHEEEGGELEVNFLYETFHSEARDAGCVLTLPGFRIMADVLTILFPSVQRVRKKERNSTETSYRGIALRALPAILMDVADFADITQCFPPNVLVRKIYNDTVACSIESQYLSNGNYITREVSFHADGKWALSICGRTVDLQSVNVSNTYSMDTDSINTVFTIVRKLPMCEGVPVKGCVIMSRYKILEMFQKDVTASAVRAVKSTECDQAVPFNSQSFKCRSCQKMLINYVEVEDKEEKEKVKQIKYLLNNANAELASLFLEQAGFISKDPRGRRWSKRLMKTCLQMYQKSHSAYKMLLSSKLLILPSTSTLDCYIKKLKENLGFDVSMFVADEQVKEINQTTSENDVKTSGSTSEECELVVPAEMEIRRRGMTVIRYLEPDKQTDQPS